MWVASRGVDCVPDFVFSVVRYAAPDVVGPASPLFLTPCQRRSFVLLAKGASPSKPPLHFRTTCLPPSTFAHAAAPSRLSQAASVGVDPSRDTSLGKLAKGAMFWTSMGKTAMQGVHPPWDHGGTHKGQPPLDSW